MEKHQRIEALLVEAEQAHGEYEAADLGGVYDQAWPSWYAGYAVDRGIGAMLGNEVTVDALTDLLTTSWDQFQAAEPTSGEPWAAFAARRIAGEL